MQASSLDAELDGSRVLSRRSKDKVQSLILGVLSLHGRRQWSIPCSNVVLSFAPLQRLCRRRGQQLCWCHSLRTAIRPIIISIDASQGGGASEATPSVTNLERRLQVSSKLAAAETNEELLSSFSTPTLACPIPSHMFCLLSWSTASFSAACFCDHPHACPLRAHDIPRAVACSPTGWFAAQLGGTVLSNSCCVLSRRNLTAAGFFFGWASAPFGALSRRKMRVHITKLI